MNIYKEDINDAKERLKAWWDHEIIDRPCIAYYLLSRSEQIKIQYLNEYFGMPWYLAQNWDDIEKLLNIFEKVAKCITFKGEAIPRLFPNYGPGIMASVFGIIPKYQSGTVWFHKKISLKDIIAHLEGVKLNKNNPWYTRLLRITNDIAKMSENQYSVAVTDLGGVMDILSSFLGPTNIILAMKRKPEVIDTCRAIILEKLLKVYNELQTIIERYVEGCNSWMPIWCPKRWYPVQSDFSAMLSPKYFKRFVLPDIITQAESMNYAIYHLDGPGQLPHLDDLLLEPSITGIQWVPGAGEKKSHHEKWMPLYKKIQSAGKNLIIDNAGEAPNRATHLYKNLNSKGLFMSLIFARKIDAAYYLPDFMGGNGAEEDYKTFKKKYRKRMKNQE